MCRACHVPDASARAIVAALKLRLATIASANDLFDGAFVTLRATSGAGVYKIVAVSPLSSVYYFPPATPPNVPLPPSPPLGDVKAKQTGDGDANQGESEFGVQIYILFGVCGLLFLVPCAYVVCGGEALRDRCLYRVRRTPLNPYEPNSHPTPCVCDL